MECSDSPGRPPGPFRFDRGKDLSRLRPVLEDRGYTQSALVELIDAGSIERLTEFKLDVAALARRTAQSSPFHTLARLFLLARTVPEEAVREALAPLDLEEVLGFGLLTRNAQGIRSAVALVPFQGLVLARDFWPEVSESVKSSDYVLGVGPATLALANLTVRRQGETVLDLGTGAGYHALMAAQHAQRVIGTDINSRALGIAALNARLNGREDIEWRLGGLYEPVADCRFDLIVSNPPFVISPRSDYLYRDGGLRGDTLSQSVIRGAPEFLREGGFAVVLFNWHHDSEQDWADRPRAWLAGSGCDAWLLSSGSEDPLRYASNWLRQSEMMPPEGHARALDEWLAYYERMGIRRISSGGILVRRRSGGKNWFRADPAPPGHPSGSCSGQIQRIFAAHDLLEDLAEDRRLLECSFALTEDHEVRQHLHAEKGRWVVQQALLRQTEGFEFTGELDLLVARIVAGCQGTQTLGELARDVAASVNADPEQVAASTVALAKKLLLSGFLTPYRAQRSPADSQQA